MVEIKPKSRLPALVVAVLELPNLPTAAPDANGRNREQATPGRRPGQDTEGTDDIEISGDTRESGPARQASKARVRGRSR